MATIGRSRSQRAPHGTAATGQQRTRIRTRVRQADDDTVAVVDAAPAETENGGLTSPMLSRRAHRPSPAAVHHRGAVNGRPVTRGTGGGGDGDGCCESRLVRRFEVMSREAQNTRTVRLKQKYSLADMDLKTTLG